MTLTCAKCGRKQPLTEEDVVSFYPRFFCLSCGEKMAFPVDEKQILEMRRCNDRDRLLRDLKGVSAEGVRRVHRDGTAQDADGG